MALPAALIRTHGIRRQFEEVSIRGLSATGGLSRTIPIVEHDDGARVVLTGADNETTELLVSAATSEQDLAWLRASGLPVARATWLILGDALSPLDTIRGSMKEGRLVLIGSRLFGQVSDEFGGLDGAWQWLQAQAESENCPVAVVVPRLDRPGNNVAMIVPAGWSLERIRRWVSQHLGDLEIFFGADTVRSMTTATQIRPRRVRKVKRGEPHSGLADADQELDHIRDQLASGLRAIRPDLFDGSGRLRKGGLVKAVQDRTGKEKLSRADILDLLRKKSS